MRWEELTAVEFEKAVKDLGVCIIAFGVLERHGNHLPLGTDYLNGHKLCVSAASIEPAIVFPHFYFGQIFEARTFPGTLAINQRIMVDLIQNVFKEISRNGIKKIILYNAHGGNSAMLKFLCQCELEQENDYQLYLYTPEGEERRKFYCEVCDTKLHGHACECETSISLYNHQELVKMETIDKEEYKPKRNLAHIPNLFTGLSWYSNYPEHYVGNANYASFEKGKKLFEFETKQLADFIKAVKEDKVLEKLSKEFHKKTEF
ncbi:MAG: creatininase family protein [Bacilli bacterium]|nr:creatininase family protein [Bacilli bacterium]